MKCFVKYWKPIILTTQNSRLTLVKTFIAFARSLFGVCHKNFHWSRRIQEGFLLIKSFEIRSGSNVKNMFWWKFTYLLPLHDWLDHLAFHSLCSIKLASHDLSTSSSLVDVLYCSIFIPLTVLMNFQMIYYNNLKN